MRYLKRISYFKTNLFSRCGEFFNFYLTGSYTSQQVLRTKLIKKKTFKNGHKLIRLIANVSTLTLFIQWPRKLQDLVFFFKKKNGVNFSSIQHFLDYKSFVFVTSLFCSVIDCLSVNSPLSNITKSRTNSIVSILLCD